MTLKVLLENRKLISILYFFQFGQKVETSCLRMFIKGLTSDINRLEAFKKNKSQKEEVEKRLAEAYLFLSEVVGDRHSLAREAVLTGFSIVPSKVLLEKIKHYAKLSGLDKLAKENTDDHDEQMEVTEDASGLHCRITASGKFSRAKSNVLDANNAGVASLLNSLNSNKDIKSVFDDLSGQLSEKKYGQAQTKLRSQTVKKKVHRNLEGLLAIQGDLITEASNYDPLDEPCKSLTPTQLNLSKQITDDLLIVLSAPR